MKHHAIVTPIILTVSVSMLALTINAARVEGIYSDGLPSSGP